MAYKLNSGMGGVICDVCRTLIDQGLSLAEYEATWGKHGDDGDICMKCKEPKGKVGRAARHTPGEREDVTVPGVRFPHLPPEEAKEPELTAEEYAARYDVERKDTTCFRCDDNATCKWAWDPYNTDGDCLARK